MDSFNLLIGSLSPATISKLRCIFTHGKPRPLHQSLLHESPSHPHPTKYRYDDHTLIHPDSLPPATIIPLPTPPAAILLIVDLFLVYGPFRTAILSFFNEIPDKTDRIQVKRAHRFMAQLGARVAGMAFLTRMFPMAFQILFDPAFNINRLAAQTPVSTNCMNLAAGYFVYDACVCILRYVDNGPAYLLHGILCCMAYCYAALSGHLHVYGAMFLLWELSTPLLWLRWMMLKGGQAETKLMSVVNYGFVAVFFGCRIVYGPVMGWDFLSHSVPEARDVGFFDVSNHSISSGGGKMVTVSGVSCWVLAGYWVALLALNGLNYYWFSQMLSAALGKKAPLKSKAY